MEPLHKRIKRLREAKGKKLGIDYGIVAFAKDVGVEYQTAQQWERPKEKRGTSPKRAREDAVAAALGVTKDVLLFGETEAHKTERRNQIVSNADDKQLEQLINFYGNLSQKSREKLIDEAQFLHTMEHPKKSTSNPLQGVPKKPTKQKEKV